jgi:hypothetical protein
MRTNYFFLHTKHPLNRSTNYTQQPQCTNGMQEGEYIAVIQKSRALLLLFNDRALIRISLHVYMNWLYFLASRNVQNVLGMCLA